MKYKMICIIFYFMNLYFYRRETVTKFDHQMAFKLLRNNPIDSNSNSGIYTYTETYVCTFKSVNHTMIPFILKVLAKYKTNYSNVPYQNLQDCDRLDNSNPNLLSKGQGLILFPGKYIDLDLKHRAETQGKEKRITT